MNTSGSNSASHFKQTSVSVSIPNSPYTVNPSAYNTHKSSYSEARKLAQTEADYIDSSMSIAKNLTDAKDRRKLMETNAQLLLNRLQALKHEEHKLRRNANDIKKKSQELLLHRINREKQKNRDMQDKEARNHTRAEQLESMRSAVVEAKNKSKAEHEKIKAMIAEKRKREAKEIRVQKAINQNMIVRAKKEIVDTNKGKSLKVKIMEEDIQIKLREYNEIKKEMMREEREKWIKEEEERILQKEKEILKLGLKEDELLEILSRAEANKNQAETEYQEITDLPVEELESRVDRYIKTEGNNSHNITKGSLNTSALQNKSLLGSVGINTSKSKLSPLALKSHDIIKVL